MQRPCTSTRVASTGPSCCSRIDDVVDVVLGRSLRPAERRGDGRGLAADREARPAMRGG